MTNLGRIQREMLRDMQVGYGLTWTMAVKSYAPPRWGAYTREVAMMTDPKGGTFNVDTARVRALFQRGFLKRADGNPNLPRVDCFGSTQTVELVLTPLFEELSGPFHV